MIVAQEQAGGTVIMRAAAGDRTAGKTARWQIDGEVARPSTRTWNRDCAARLDLHIKTTATRSCELFVYARTDGVAPGTPAWLSVQVNGNARIVGDAGLGRAQITANGWRWVRISDAFTLQAGTSTITLHSIDAHLQIQRVAVQPVSASTVSDGSTALGTASAEQGSEPAVQDQTLRDWLTDGSRDAYRALLIDVDHADRARRFGTRAHLSDALVPYPDHLVGTSYIESTLDAQAPALGNLSFIDPDLSDDPVTQSWRGAIVGWRFGDLQWPDARFARLATGVVDRVRSSGDRRYRFDLLSNASTYDEPFHEGEPITHELGAQALVDTLIGAYTGAASVDWLNVDAATLATVLRVEITDSTTLLPVLRTIARSLGLVVRTGSAGRFEFLSPPLLPDDLAITDANVIAGSVRVLDTIEASRRVRIWYADDADIERESAADTGVFDEVVEIDTYLVSLADVQALAEIEVDRHSRTQRLYQVRAVGIGPLVMPGERISAPHRQIRDTGVVQRVRHTPTDSADLLEILV